MKLLFWCHLNFGELRGRQGLGAQGQDTGCFQESSSIEKYLLGRDLKQQSKQSQGKAVGLSVDRVANAEILGYSQARLAWTQE